MLPANGNENPLIAPITNGSVLSAPSATTTLKTDTPFTYMFSVPVKLLYTQAQWLHTFGVRVVIESNTVDPL
jgi:hypothetical protein